MVTSCRIYPWRYGNQFELLVNGDAFFARMLAAIAASEQRVLFEMYLVESGAVTDRFVSALTTATGRGVHVAALFDDFGSRGLRTHDRRRLTEGGVELRFYNTLAWSKRLANLLRNHRKLLLVDDHVAFVGGMGLTDEFAGPDAWRETVVAIEGPVVADWASLFLRTWSRRGHCHPALQCHPRVAGFDDGAAGRVASSENWRRAELAASIHDRIRSARRRVWITTPYFVSTRRLRKLLRLAARRGVDVKLLGPGPQTDHPGVRHAARRYYGKLLRNGVRIFEYQPRVLHAKSVICDDWVSIGSTNLDRWGFKWNLEANQEVEHRPFANRAAAMFEDDCRASMELDRSGWARRPWLDRLLEDLTGWLDRTLDRWRRPRTD